MAEHAAGRTAGRWLDVKLAAEELGISSDAVRKRISRGTLRYAKRDDGSVRVWLDGVDDRLDADQPSKQPPGWPEARHRLDDLIDAKDEALRDLHGSSCGHGSRASACGSCYAADTYALTRHYSGVCGAGSILMSAWGVK